MNNGKVTNCTKCNAVIYTSLSPPPLFNSTWCDDCRMGKSATLVGVGHGRPTHTAKTPTTTTSKGHGKGKTG